MIVKANAKRRRRVCSKFIFEQTLIRPLPISKWCSCEFIVRVRNRPCQSELNGEVTLPGNFLSDAGNDLFQTTLGHATAELTGRRGGGAVWVPPKVVWRGFSNLRSRLNRKGTRS
jgi:hypothetical protein